MTVGCRVQQQGRKKSPLLSCMDPPGNMQMKRGSVRKDSRLLIGWLTFNIFPWTSWCGSFTAFWLKSFNGSEDSSSVDVLWLIDPTVQPLVKILLIITCGVLEGVLFLWWINISLVEELLSTADSSTTLAESSSAPHSHSLLCSPPFMLSSVPRWNVSHSVLCVCVWCLLSLAPVAWVSVHEGGKGGDGRTRG